MTTDTTTETTSPTYPPNTGFARGVDIAAVDGNSNIDWAKARDEGGITFAGIKRSQHVYPDRQCASSTEGALAAGIVVMHYHFPGWAANCASAKAQIGACKQVGIDMPAGKFLPLAIDVESGGAGFATIGRPRSELVEVLRQHVFEVQDQLGMRPVIYTSWNQWYDLGLPAAPWAAECILWIKTAYRLAANQPVDQVEYAEPHFGPSATDPRDYHRCPDAWANSGWIIQQGQGDTIGFPGFNKTVDVNRMRLMRAGDRGPHIAWLQRRLGVDADGDFGPHTAMAVDAARQAAGLPTGEVIDAATLSIIARK